MSTDPRIPRHPWSVVGSALLAAVVVTGARLLLIGLRDGYLADGLFGLALRSSARHLLEGAAWSVPPALGLSWLAARPALVPRPLVRGLGLLLVAGILGYLFVGFRLPHLPWYEPGTVGAKAKAVHLAAALAGLVAGALLLRPPHRCAARHLVLAILALLVLAATVPFAVPGIGPRRGEQRNVILLSLDTVRADHLGCYGYDRPTSPELDRLAAESLVFDRACTPQPWTLSAHMTMLTGLYPSVHGVDEFRSLSPGAQTIAASLRRAGFATVAVVDRVEWLQPRFGFDRGFQVYENLPDDAEMKVDRILRLVDEVGDTPLFLFAHFYDAHSDWRVQPYDADPRDTAEFAGDYDGAWEVRGEEVVRATDYLQGFRERGEIPPADELAHVVDQYDAGVRTLDRELGRLLRGLEARGLLDRSTILVTADHGEEFFEHGQPLHAQYFRETIHVPFLLRVPGGPTGRVEELVSLVDIVPTLLDLAGIPPLPSQGRSLAPLVRGEALAPRSHVLLVDRNARWGLRTAAWSVLPGAEQPRFFDLAADPGERHELTDEPPFAGEARQVLERANRIGAALRARFGATDEDVDLSDEELEHLRALGYGGG